jgi:RNA polymerase sigma-70 factor (ECF subfamily)
VPPRSSALDALSDEALLAGLASGDASAGRAFVGRYQAKVYGVAIGLLKDRSAAEDIAQEAFVRAWRHAAAYDARRGSVTAWLLRITRNLAIDALRLRHPDFLDPGLLAGLDVPAEGSSVEDAVVLSEASARVRVALQQIPLEQRRALMLAAFYGHTAEEISASEQIPLGTAKTRIRMGLGKVRTMLIEPAELDEMVR